jgi:gas vesicle protein
METKKKEFAHGNNGLNILFGVLIGGLAGAITMLLMAPQSGKRTRAQIQEESILLLDRTTKNVKKAAAKIASETNRVAVDVQLKAGELKHLGQEKLVEQLDRVSAALDTGKKAVEAV